MWNVLTIVVSSLFAAQSAFATTYDDAHLTYRDPPQDLSTRIAISVLTDEGVLQGDPEGTIRPNDTLNRAEFVTIVMRMVPPTRAMAPRCFRDVPSSAWYAEAVCAAKELRIIRGNAQPDVPQEQWLFEPARDVQYEEAVKVLVELFDVPTQSTPGPAFAEATAGKEWYERYLRAAETSELALPGSVPGDRITRGEMARLVVAFLANSRGELRELRLAEGAKESKEVQEVKEFGSSAAHSFSSFSSFSSLSSFQTDPHSDVSQDEDFLLLGTTGPVMASANIFSTAEPLDVREIRVRLTSAASSIDAFLVYDHDAQYLGRASLDTSVSGSIQYTLFLKTRTISIGHQEDYSFYVRPTLRRFADGGTSGQTAQISSLTVIGDGAWSNNEYMKGTSETYNTFQVARSRITRISSVAETEAPLVAGTDQPLGSFLFEGSLGDPSADLRVTSLTFQIDNYGGISLSNVTLKASDAPDRHTCSVGASTITCSSLSAEFGSFEDAPRTLTVYGDIAIPSGLQSAALRLTLNQTGGPTSSGDVTWTDGTTSFSWVTGDNPIARGTYFSQ